MGGEDRHEIKIPDFDSEGKTLPDPRIEVFDVERVFEVLVEYEHLPIHGLRPGLNPFKLFQKIFPKSVCPVGLLDPQFGRILDTAMLCKHYNVLPCAGGLWDQPQRVIECMRVIAEAEAAFKNDGIEAMKQSSKKG